MNQEVSAEAVVLYPPNAEKPPVLPPDPAKMGEVVAQKTLAVVGIGFAPVQSPPAR